MEDDDFKRKLTPEQYRVLRQQYTEPPFSGDLLYNRSSGQYICAACGNLLFSSKDKYDSDTPGLIGWPSFSKLAANAKVKLIEDNSFGMQRTEVVCQKCGSHLGHLFPDKSSPTGDHFCINSVSLEFKQGKDT